MPDWNQLSTVAEFIDALVARCGEYVIRKQVLRGSRATQPCDWVRLKNLKDTR
jgi:hypothetical protein